MLHGRQSWNIGLLASVSYARIDLDGLRVFCITIRGGHLVINDFVALGAVVVVQIDKRHRPGRFLIGILVQQSIRIIDTGEGGNQPWWLRSSEDTFASLPIRRIGKLNPGNNPLRRRRCIAVPVLLVALELERDRAQSPFFKFDATLFAVRTIPGAAVYL